MTASAAMQGKQNDAVRCQFRLAASSACVTVVRALGVLAQVRFRAVIPDAVIPVSTVLQPAEPPVMLSARRCQRMRATWQRTDTPSMRPEAHALSCCCSPHAAAGTCCGHVTAANPAAALPRGPAPVQLHAEPLPA